jgi:uncharacterized protein (TIGR02421 family)
MARHHEIGAKTARLDSALLDVGKNIKILSDLAWEPTHHITFIENWQKNNPKLPEVNYPVRDLSAQKQTLEQIIAECDLSNPLQNFLSQTAASYHLGAQMIENLGKPQFSAISQQIYGNPRDCMAFTNVSALEAANHFIEVTGSLIKSSRTEEAEVCLMAEHVKEEMEKIIKPFFKNHPVEIVVDHKLVSKAAAGASRIRIRNFTCFSPSDIPQLVEHEAFVHTLTLINGRNQKHLRCLGLGAPRTTCTQEGLALFAELITTSIDLGRLRRIAARVKGVDMALSGANFIEVFKFFLECGQSESEAFFSAMRVFRGGDVRGRIAFTKDITYLQGFVEVHKFLEDSIKNEHPEYSKYLFAGRLTSADVITLEEFFKNKTLEGPLYEPRWIKNKNALMAFLVYSRFISKLGLTNSNN